MRTRGLKGRKFYGHHMYMAPYHTHMLKWESIIRYTVRGYKVNHLAINSTTAVAGKAGFTLASAATAVVEFMAK